MDPYRVMFPLGLAFAVAGAAVWIAFAMFGEALPGAYPSVLHANLMIGGFMLSFAAGFLGTAAPRLTGAPGFSRRELKVAAATGGLLVGCVLAGSAPLFHLVVILALSLLGAALRTRLRRRRRTPPPTLVIAGSGLFCGLAGNAAILLALADVAPPVVMAWGRLAFYHGMMLGLVLGVGSFLVAVLLGWRTLPEGVDASGRSPGDGEAPSRSATIRPGTTGRWRTWLWPVTAALALPASFVLDVAGAATVGGLMRAAMATVTGLALWRLYRLPRHRTVLAFAVWLSCWCIVLGLYLYALAPGLAIHAAHLEFIGGFGLLTMAVATRVTLAHGGHDLQAERRSPWLAAATALILLAAATRVAAPFVPAFYITHLAYAAATWIVGLALWCVGFLPKLWRV